MKRLERSKLFVVDYTIEARYPTFILADNVEDAIKEHRKTFPHKHRGLKLIQFLSPAPFITDKIARRDIVEAEKNESSPIGEKAMLEKLENQPAEK